MCGSLWLTDVGRVARSSPLGVLAFTSRLPHVHPVLYWRSIRRQPRLETVSRGSSASPVAPTSVSRRDQNRSPGREPRTRSPRVPRRRQPAVGGCDDDDDAGGFSSGGGGTRRSVSLSPARRGFATCRVTPPGTSETFCSSATAGCGKTSLADAMLFAAGTVNRKGSVADGTSLRRLREGGEGTRPLDLLQDPARRPPRQAINLIDTPGTPDLIGQAIACRRSRRSRW